MWFITFWLAFASIFGARAARRGMLLSLLLMALMFYAVIGGVSSHSHQLGDEPEPPPSHVIEN
jgi:ABC-type transport system involved in cytochrome c biogenesis permease component